MPHPNQTMIRTAYDAVSSGELHPMLNMLSDDIRWNVSGESPLAGDYQGKDGVLQFFGAMAHEYDNTLNVQVLEVLANDRRAVVLTAESGTVDGHQLEWSSAHIFTIADRVVTSFTSYQDDAYHAFWSAQRADRGKRCLEGDVDPDSMPSASRDAWDGAGEHPFEHVVLGDTRHRGGLGRGDQPLGEVEVFDARRRG